MAKFLGEQQIESGMSRSIKIPSRLTINSKTVISVGKLLLNNKPENVLIYLCTRIVSLIISEYKVLNQYLIIYNNIYIANIYNMFVRFIGYYLIVIQTMQHKA